MKQSTDNDAGDVWDVAILGSGMAGTVLAAILARHRVRVVVLDAKHHPRFAVGEASIRETTMMLKNLAARFDVPELLHVTSYAAVHGHVAPTCGMKRNIGYVYHREGQPPRADEVFQVVVPETFEGPEVHFFRQDVDAHLARVAKAHGATIREGARVDDVELDDDQVRLRVRAASGATSVVAARYVVDAGGYRSVLARTQGLREQPTRFQTHSRSIFTHMTGVTPYERCASARGHQVAQPWSQGTLHHCFDGGWMWVIPFDNGMDPRANPVVSVGLQLDNRRYPYRGLAPEAEFSAMLERFSGIAEAFESARPARPWSSTGPRMQYSSRRTIGPRFCLTAHAAGSVDALFSRGLVLTMRATLPLAEALLDAVEADDFAEERFEPLDQLHQRTLDNTDAIVAGMYTAFSDFELFDAFVRFWYATGVLGFFQIEAAHAAFRRTGDPDAMRRRLDGASVGSSVGSLCSALPSFSPFFDAVIEQTRAVAAGRDTAATAAAAIRARLRRAEFLPPGFHFDEPGTVQGGPFDVEHWRQIVTWGNFDAPAEVKDALYPGDAQRNVDAFMARVESALRSPHLAEVRRFIAAQRSGAPS